MDKSTISIVGVASVEVGGISFSLRFGFTAFTSINDRIGVGIGNSWETNTINIVQSFGGPMGSFGSLDSRGLLGSHSTIGVDNKVGVSFSLAAFASINNGISIGVGKNGSTNTIGIAQSLGSEMGSFGSLNLRGFDRSHGTVGVSDELGISFSLTTFTSGAGNRSSGGVHAGGSLDGGQAEVVVSVVTGKTIVVWVPVVTSIQKCRVGLSLSFGMDGSNKCKKDLK